MHGTYVRDSVGQKVRIRCGHRHTYISSVFYVVVSLFKSSFSHLCPLPCNVHHSNRSSGLVFESNERRKFHILTFLPFNRFFSPLLLWIDFLLVFFLLVFVIHTLCGFPIRSAMAIRHAKNAGHWLLNFYKISISSVWLSINFDSSWASQTHDSSFTRAQKKVGKRFVFWHSDHFPMDITDNGVVGHVECPKQGQNKQNLLLFVLFAGWKTV